VTTVKKRRKTAVSRGTERICAHFIDWRLYDRDIQLSDIDVEHIQNLLIENNLSGKLCTVNSKGNEVSGWWSIQM
jgi:GH18 family chitinase